MLTPQYVTLIYFQRASLDPSPRAKQVPLNKCTQGGASTHSCASTKHPRQTIEALLEEVRCGRAIGFLGDLREHLKSVSAIPNKNKLACAVCGMDTYQRCSICMKPLHTRNEPRGVENSVVPCFFMYHDTGCVGLARDGFKLIGKRRRDWKMPNEDDVKTHYKAMKRMYAWSKKGSNSGASGNNNTTNTSDSSQSSDNNKNDENWNDQCL